MSNESIILFPELMLDLRNHACHEGTSLLREDVEGLAVASVWCTASTVTAQTLAQLCSYSCTHSTPGFKGHLYPWWVWFYYFIFKGAGWLYFKKLDKNSILGGLGQHSLLRTQRVLVFPDETVALAGLAVHMRRSDYNPSRRDGHESMPQKVINLTVSCSLSRNSALRGPETWFILPLGECSTRVADFGAHTPTVSTAKAAAAPGRVESTYRAQSSSKGVSHGVLQGSLPGQGRRLKILSGAHSLLECGVPLASNKWAQGTPTSSCQTKHRMLARFELQIISKLLLCINISFNINIT